VHFGTLAQPTTGSSLSPRVPFAMSGLPTGKLTQGGSIVGRWAVARLDEIDELADGAFRYRPVRHHLGITE
jgi:hypothetical protein